MKKVLKFWIPLALGLTGAFAAMCLVSQDTYRKNADDPQLQISEDIAAVLSTGEDPSGLEQQTKVDLSKSLASFLVVFDKDAKAVASNAQLNNETPKIPESAIKAATEGNPHRVTWMTDDGKRFAMVITKYEGPTPGYLAVGRSLREIENRKNAASQLIAMAWGGTMIVTLAATWLLMNTGRKRDHSPVEKAPESTESKE